MIPPALPSSLNTAGSRPRASQPEPIALDALDDQDAALDRIFDELIAFGLRLGLAASAGIGDDLTVLDCLHAAEVEAAQHASAALAAAPHNTEMERLWIQYDPEFTIYQQALALLKRDSAEAPEFMLVLSRKSGWLDGIDTFDVRPAADQSRPYAEFNDPTEDVVAVAIGGTVRACKK